ncbi:hypothetical protein BGZ52_002417 [Haplosporangium bisporale]|nr:hypothetical protein BGZ52_002417 [Haplosporangium bisporale]
MSALGPALVTTCIPPPSPKYLFSNDSRSRADTRHKAWSLPDSSKTKLGRPPRWTPEMDEELTRLRAANRTWEYISLAVGRSSSACADRYNTVLDPSLKTWTPGMIARMDQMVEEGVSWKDIANNLNAKIIACQHQWRTVGKGKLRVKGIAALPTTAAWSNMEMEVFWSSWIANGGAANWDLMTVDLGSRDAKEYRAGLRQLIMSTIMGAPGWAKLEIFNYVSEVTRAARSRAREEENKAFIDTQQDRSWTPAEHAALLKAVEKHGLFSGWSKIREQVKPHVTDDEVEAEYYRLNGVNDEVSEKPQDEIIAEASEKEGTWTEEEVVKLNLMLMKYSTLPVWTREAAKNKVKPSDEDYERLFQNTNPSDEDASITSGKGNTEGSNLSEWNSARTSRLRRLQQQSSISDQPIDWDWVADHIGPGFNANMCITHWHALPEGGSKLEPAKYWDQTDIEKLQLGIQKYGRSWINIQREYFPDRTTDSIRRKVSNVQNRRDKLVREQRKLVMKIKRTTDPNVDVEKHTHEGLKADPVYQLAMRMDVLMKAFDEATKARKKAEAQETADVKAQAAAAKAKAEEAKVKKHSKKKE